MAQGKPQLKFERNPYKLRFHELNADIVKQS